MHRTIMYNFMSDERSHKISLIICQYIPEQSLRVLVNKSFERKKDTAFKFPNASDFEFLFCVLVTVLFYYQVAHMSFIRHQIS